MSESANFKTLVSLVEKMAVEIDSMRTCIRYLNSENAKLFAILNILLRTRTISIDDFVTELRAYMQICGKECHPQIEMVIKALTSNGATALTAEERRKSFALVKSGEEHGK